MKSRILVLLIAIFSVPALFAQIYYRVEGNGLNAPSFIFGTHHLAPLSILDSIPSLEKDFDSCSQVVGEIDMTVNQMALAMKMQPYMMAPADSTLSMLVDPTTFARICEEFKPFAPMPGVELSMLDGMKPMVATSMVAVGMVQKSMPDYNPEQQLDTFFQNKGVAANKKITPLETPEQQARLLYCSTPLTQQAEALVDILDNPEDELANALKLNEAYMRHDINALLSLSQEAEEAPEFFVKLLDERNSYWIRQLPAIMEEGPAFIAVGALHLPGEKGVVKGLRDAGYTVTPIK